MEHAGIINRRHGATDVEEEGQLLPDRGSTPFAIWCETTWSWFCTTRIGISVVAFLPMVSWIKTWGVVPLAAAWSILLFLSPFIFKNESNLVGFVALFLTLWNCVICFVVCMVKPTWDSETGTMAVLNIFGVLCEAVHVYRLAYWEWDAIVVGLLVVLLSVVWAVTLWCRSTTPSVLFEGLSGLGIATTASAGVGPLLAAIASEIPLHFNLWLPLFSMGNAAMWTLHGIFSFQGATAAANAISCCSSVITFLWVLFERPQMPPTMAPFSLS